MSRSDQNKLNRGLEALLAADLAPEVLDALWKIARANVQSVTDDKAALLREAFKGI